MSNEAICLDFSEKIGAVFPDCYINARPVRVIGDDAIWIDFANVKSPKDATNGILENAPAFMRFAVYGDKEYYYIERPVMHYNDKALKFRKITGKSRAEVVDKLAAWMTKNKDVILSSRSR